MPTSKPFTRHLEYSRQYLQGLTSSVSTLPASSGRANKTIETRKQKYGPKATSAEAIDKAKAQ